MYSKNTLLQEISVKTMKNRDIALGKLLTDKPLYLKFWATWCQPCRKQMPHFQSTYNKYSEQIDIIAVNLGVNDDLHTITDIKHEFSLKMPIVIDHTGKLAQRFNLKGTPLSVLIDRDGNVVFKGHTASDDLDNALQHLLKSSDTHRAPVPIDTDHKAAALNIPDITEGTQVLFFTATWCDWYLEKTRPETSLNCINAQKAVNLLYKNNTDLNFSGILSRLWTEENELDEYRKKYDIQYPVHIDTDNELFIKYKINNFPSLVVLKNGRVKLKLEDFSNMKSISEKISQF